MSTSGGDRRSGEDSSEPQQTPDGRVAVGQGRDDLETARLIVASLLGALISLRQMRQPAEPDGIVQALAQVDQLLSAAAAVPTSAPPCVSVEEGVGRVTE